MLLIAYVQVCYLSICISIQSDGQPPKAVESEQGLIFFFFFSGILLLCGHYDQGETVNNL